MTFNHRYTHFVGTLIVSGIIIGVPFTIQSIASQVHVQDRKVTSNTDTKKNKGKNDQNAQKETEGNCNSDCNVNTLIPPITQTLYDNENSHEVVDEPIITIVHPPVEISTPIFSVEYDNSNYNSNMNNNNQSQSVTQNSNPSISITNDNSSSISNSNSITLQTN